MSAMFEHTASGHRACWLADGDAGFAAMVAAIDTARTSVRLESYIIRAAGPALQVRAALMAACARGVAVSVLYDAFGCEDLPADFFAALATAGARVAAFSPARSLRLAFRNHRKLLVCDERVAIIGGLNLAPEYAGDGVTRGWCDLALQIEGPVAAQLAASFDAMLLLAPATPRALRNFRRRVRRWPAPQGAVSLLLGGPGWPAGQLQQTLLRDLAGTGQLCAMVAYFLPSGRLRRALRRCHERGGGVRLLLAGPTDVPVARYAGEHFYARLMRGGARLFEYRPQVLHAKLVIADDVVYAGSANLDRRSLTINYELLLRLDWPELAAAGRALFDAALVHAEALRPGEWLAARGLWARLRSTLSYWLLARVDPFVARRRLRSLR